MNEIKSMCYINENTRIIKDPLGFDNIVNWLGTHKECMLIWKNMDKLNLSNVSANILTAV